MRFKYTQLRQRGDTIVEVLIAIAVVSTVLAGAFTVTQKSTQAVRSSQERGEMLQLLQGQIELVRSAALQAVDSSDDIFDPNIYFCMDESDGSRKPFPASFSAVGNPAGYPVSVCKQRGPGQLYAYIIRYDDSANVFKATGRWEGLGSKMNIIDLSYRINPGPLTTFTAAATPTLDDIAASFLPLSQANNTTADGGGTTTSLRCFERDDRTGWLDPRCWKVRLVNTSNNTSGKLTKCTWDWDDGTVETYSGSAPECQYDTTTTTPTVTHQYVPQNTEPNRVRFDIVLTNYPVTGPPKAYPKTIYRPN